MRNKTKSQKHLPPIPPFFLGLTLLLYSLPPPPEWCRSWGTGVTVSSPHVVSVAPSSSHSFPAQVRGPTHRRQFSMNFSNLSLSHELKFITNCCSVSLSHGVQSFRNRMLQRGSPTGSQVLPENLLHYGLLSLHGSTGPARSLLQRGLLMGSQLPSGNHLLRRVVLLGLLVDTSSTVDLHGLQGHSLPHHGLHHRLQWNLCSGAWSTSCPSFNDLGVCRVVSLTSSYSSLLLQMLLRRGFFPSYKCYHRGTTSVVDGLGPSATKILPSKPSKNYIFKSRYFITYICFPEVYMYLPELYQRSKYIRFIVCSLTSICFFYNKFSQLGILN